MALKFKDGRSFEEIINSPECLNYSGKVIVEQEKPDWRQWLPLYGYYQMGKDAGADKPVICDFNHKLRYFGGMAYHATVSIMPIFEGVAYLVDKF